MAKVKEIEKPEEIKEIEAEEKTEEIAAAPSEPVEIMDAKDSAEPKKKAPKKEFENKLDFTPILNKLDEIANSVIPKAAAPKKSEQGFTDILGDW